MAQVVRSGGTDRASTEILTPWEKRKTSGHKDRKRYERQWHKAMHFAAGKQWLVVNPTDGRVVEQRVDDRGRRLRVTDVLGQYTATVVGKMSSGGFRPELLTEQKGVEGQQVAEAFNDGFGWGWEHEWDGDRKFLALVRTLAILGTGAMRPRYDRGKGKPLGQRPFYDGKPIMDPALARAHVADTQAAGGTADIRPVLEGRICLDLLTPWNLLPPPGVDDPFDFPYDLIVRPVALDLLRQTYGQVADELSADDVVALDMLGATQQNAGLRATTQQPTTSTGKLEEHALVYTGYARPCPDYPSGQTVVWAGKTILDYEDGLPVDADEGPRSGITYFRWTILPQRFWGRSFVDPGLDPQEIRNKRLSQTDEIIDRSLPKVYLEEGSLKQDPFGVAMEMVELKPGTAKPVLDNGLNVGPWISDIELQDANIEKALGLHGVSLGQAPAGVSPYAAMAMLSENDASKLEPVSTDFKLNVALVSKDLGELMRLWPPAKTMMIAGDDNTLRQVSFDSKRMVPTRFLVRPAPGGALPRSQAALVQKITDVWNAALQSGLVVHSPVHWLEWYAKSIQAGEPLDLPDIDHDPQVELAHHENALMIDQSLPVMPSEYDLPEAHLPVHLAVFHQLRAANNVQAAHLLKAHIDMSVEMLPLTRSAWRPQSPDPAQQVDMEQLALDEDQVLRENQMLVAGQPLNPEQARQAMQAVQRGVNPESGQPLGPQDDPRQLVENAGLKPTLTENIQLHMTRHGMVIKSSSFLEFPPDVRQRFLTHYDLTRDLFFSLPTMPDKVVAPHVTLALRESVGPSTIASVLRRAGVPEADAQTLAVEPPMENQVQRDDTALPGGSPSQQEQAQSQPPAFDPRV